MNPVSQLRCYQAAKPDLALSRSGPVFPAYHMLKIAVIGLMP